MSGKYEGYLQALLAPLGLYDLTGGRQQGGELAALGAALDGVDDRLALAEREAFWPRRRERDWSAGRHCSGESPPL